MKPEEVSHNAFTTNLTPTEFVAIGANGHPIGRAATEEGLRRACPDAAAYFSAADFAYGGTADPVGLNREVVDAYMDDLNATGSAFTKLDPDGTFESVAPEGFYAPGETAAAKPRKIKTSKVQDPLSWTDKPESDDYADTPDKETYIEELDRTAYGGSDDTEKHLGATNPFDHDGDGIPGGSKKGAESTAAKGAARKRKPKA